MKYSSVELKHKTWAEIDLSRLRNNYAEIRRSVNAQTEVMCVVKADAYGHGAEKCAVALYEAGARWFAVSCIEEAMQLRAAFDSRLLYGSKILILGYTPPENAAMLAKYDIRQTVYSSEYAKDLSASASKQGCAVRVHFKLDTGMNRLGFDAETNAAEAILEASKLEGIAAEGLFTHFACADEDDENDADSVTRKQFERFRRVDEELSQKGLHLIRHACNSAGTVKYPEFHLDMVRVGIILYGLLPCPIDSEKFSLLPVMTFKSTIAHIHTVRKGERVSYGGIYKAEKDVCAATVPVGYADGFIRGFAGGGIYVNGKFAPIIGRICMDQCMADISDIPDAEVGGEVVLFGGKPEMLDELARIAGTINYELVCLIGKRVARIYSE